MLRIILATAAAGFLFAGPAGAMDMMKCDDATMSMVMAEVDKAPADKKEMAMKEFEMAKEKMAGNMADDCAMHLEAASKAAMGG
jgi:hypothetical protein